MERDGTGWEGRKGEKEREGWTIPESPVVPSGPGRGTVLVRLAPTGTKRF